MKLSKGQGHKQLRATNNLQEPEELDTIVYSFVPWYSGLYMQAVYDGFSCEVKGCQIDHGNELSPSERMGMLEEATSLMKQSPEITKVHIPMLWKGSNSGLLGQE